LPDTDFSNSNLFHTTFDGAIMDRAKLNKAYMFASRLNDVQARQADFTKAKLNGASLRRVTLDETIFSEANLDQADFTGAVIENMDEPWFRHAINLPIHLQKMLGQ
jgi:uncharacterized protein YjbI with pentapeptide repeats